MDRSFDTGGNNYFCTTDTASNPTVDYYCDPPSFCTVLNVTDSSINYKFDLFFNNNGDMQYIDSTKDKYVDYRASTCSNILFNNTSYNDIFIGAGQSMAINLS